MAGLLFHTTISSVSLSAGVAKTILQIACAANHRVKVKSLEVYFQGTVSTDTPVFVRFLRQTSLGTMSSLTPAKNNSADDETIQTSVYYAASVEPTAGTVLKQMYIHPQIGVIQQFQLGDEVILPGGTRLGIEMTAAQAQTCAAQCLVEE